MTAPLLTWPIFAGGRTAPARYGGIGARQGPPAWPTGPCRATLLCATHRPWSSGAVGSDDGQYLPGTAGQRHVGDRLDAAVCLLHRAHIQARGPLSGAFRVDRCHAGPLPRSSRAASRGSAL